MLLCPWGFSRQEYWSGLPCPPSGDLPNSGIKPPSLTSPALADGFFTTSGTCEQIVFPRICVELLNEGLPVAIVVWRVSAEKNMFTLVLGFQPMLGYLSRALGVLPTPLISGPWPLSDCQSALLHYLTLYWMIICFSNCTFFQSLAHTWHSPSFTWSYREDPHWNVFPDCIPGFIP